MIITLMVTTICTGFWILSDKYRLSTPVSPWHTHNEYWITLKRLFFNHSLSDNIGAYLLSVIYHVPKILA